MRTIIRTLLAFICTGLLVSACNKSLPLDPTQTCNDSKATNFGGPLPCQYPTASRSVVFNLRGGTIAPMGDSASGGLMAVCARPGTGSPDGTMDMTLVYDTTPDASVQLYIFDTSVQLNACSNAGVQTPFCSDYLAAEIQGGLPAKVQAAGTAAQLQKNLCFLVRNRSSARITLLSGSTIGFTPSR